MHSKYTIQNGQNYFSTIREAGGEEKAEISKQLSNQEGEKEKNTKKREEEGPCSALYINRYMYTCTSVVLYREWLQ